jgi:glycosyltransferase involved in cell wall biosynthesis
LVEKNTDDFVRPVGCLVALSSSQLPGKPADFIIYRSFNRSLVRAAKTMFGSSTIEVTYDQRPVGDGFALKIEQVIWRFYRKLKGRPEVRISPNSRFRSNRWLWVGKYEGYFVHPGPKVRKDSAQTEKAQYSVITVSKKFDERKRLDVLLEVINRIPEKMKVAVVNSSPQRTGSTNPSISQKLYFERVQKLIRESKHEIKVFEDLSQVDVLDLMSRSRVFALFSDKEPFSVSNIESLSQGTPCLIKKSNGSSSFLRNKGAFTFESSAPKGRIVNQLTNILEQSDKNMRETVLRNYQQEQNSEFSLASLLLSLEKKGR